MAGLPAAVAPAGASRPVLAAPVKPAGLVDINTASTVELKTLPGVGDAEARRIIAARPYPSKAKLVVDRVISEPVYLGLKGRIVAAQPDAASPRTAKSMTASKP